MSKNGLLHGDADRLSAYLRTIADLCGLRDWVFEVFVLPGRDLAEHAGTCAVFYGRQRARIEIAEDWPHWTPRGLRQTVVHELIHCHIQQITTVFDHVRSQLADQVSTMSEMTYRVAMEHAVDGIATAWAETLPLPVKEKTA